MTDLTAINDFLPCETPVEWLQEAANNLDFLMIDHAHCEKKAASTAMNLLFRYVDRAELLTSLSQLAREELLHFEQVIEMMGQRNVTYQHLEPSRYAGELRKHVRHSEPGRLVDILIVGAFIEARSCERFAALIDYVDEELAKYYQFLLKSESRHFVDYLNLAKLYSPEDIGSRVEHFAAVEAALVLGSDEQFRFHSGIPIKNE